MRSTWCRRPDVRVILLIWAGLALPTSSVRSEPLPKLQEIRVPSTDDGTEQPARLWVPVSASSQPTPLLVSLHTWSYDYTQDRSEWLNEAVQRGWIYLQPNFRGRNDHPEACGSPAARQDILDAMDWVSDRYQVDAHRIYLAGVSGGGHMTLLMAGRHPERFSAASAWVGISDLTDWYRFHEFHPESQRYARMIAACCGGAPGTSDDIDRQYQERSSIHFLQHAVGLPLDINAGVHDGKSGSVPIHHSLRAFNDVAAAGGHATIAESDMDVLWETGRLSAPRPEDTAEDRSYGRDILLRRRAGEARVTIFEGGHEGLAPAACEWLSQQSRVTRTPAASR